jgi:hypothetical protein
MAGAWYDGSDRWTLLNFLNNACEVSESTGGCATAISIDWLALGLCGHVLARAPRVHRARAAWALGWLRREGLARYDGRLWSITPFGRMEVKRRVEAAVHVAMTRPVRFTAADLGMTADEFRKLCESLPRAEAKL